MLLATVGCGSGIVASTSQSQNMAVPVASAKGPQLGYLWLDADHTLRPILGVAGASQVGQSLVPAGLYSGAASSASAALAVLQDSEGSFDLMTLPAGSPVSLGTSLPPGASIRLSPSASSALVYAPGATSATLITGLQSTIQLQTIKVAGSIVDSAVSDTGTAAFETSQGGSVAVSVVSLNGRAAPLASVQSAGGLTFFPGRDDLLFADAGANSLNLVRAATTAPAATVLPTGSLLKTPSAVGISGSGRWVIVANSASQSVVRVDLTTQASISVTCSCKPTEASALADDGAFRVTNVASGANWIVDAAPATPRTLFIPALPAPAKTSLVASTVIP